jgi:2-polyprenyl-3-methyl-5-hydroxy-6-metoxy-1,4-benzoquinol methylase
LSFIWNQKKIHWFQEADIYAGFSKNVARLLAPKLAGYTTLCDIGCGLGLIDIELSQSIPSITCIDISPEAIEALNKNIAERGITNIKPLLLDFKEIKGGWDVILISFFGYRHLEHFLNCCRKLIVVVGQNNQSELYPEKYRKSPKFTAMQLEQVLNQKGIPYSLTEAAFEFGQPLVSLEDAEEFVRTQAPEITDEDLASFLALRLVETGDAKYPFLLPRLKSIGIFDIEGKLQFA